MFIVLTQIMGFLLIVMTCLLGIVEKLSQKHESMHPRRRELRATNAGWGKAMWDALLRLFSDPTQPPPAAELTMVQETRVMRTDPDMEGLPSNARPHIACINEMIERIGRRIEGDVLGQPLVIEMEQMRDVHLPKLVRSYVEIPANHRVQIYTQTGKSASVHLVESLEAMERRLKEIDRDLSRENLDAFSDNARFISRTYGQGSDPLS